MKRVKEDDVSPVTKLIVDKIHAGRRQDSRFWRSEFDDGEISGEEPGGGLILMKILKVISFLVMIGLLVVCMLVALIYFRPNVFPSLTHSTIYQTLSRYLPESDAIVPLNKPMAPEQVGGSDGKVKEYTFSQEQIDKAKYEVNKSKKEMGLSNNPPAQIKFNTSDEPIRYRYEIEFVSGGRVYSENVRMSGDTLTFENNKGLVVSVNKNDIKTMKRFPLNNQSAGK